MDQETPAANSPATVDPSPTATRTPREVWFLVTVGAMIVALLLLSPAVFVVLGWFTEAYRDTAASSEVSHRLHEIVFGAFFTLALVGAVSQLGGRRNPAGLIQLTLALTTLAIMVGLTVGRDPGLLLYLIPLAGVWVFRGPIRPIMEGRRAHWWALTLTLLITPSMVGEIEGHVAKALSAAQNHTTHWSVMATFSMTLLMLGLVATFPIRGRRLVIWSLTAASTTYGIAALAFPYDASSHRPAHAIALILWGVAWTLGLWFERRRSPSVARRRLIRLLIAGLLAPVVMIGSIFVAALDDPPNVPHRPDPDRPEVVAAEVDRETCLGCHAGGAAGATQPSHELSRTCFADVESCWSGRADCAGCHRIDPALGGPTELFHALLPTGSTRLATGPPTGGEALDRETVEALRDLGSGS